MLVADDTSARDLCLLASDAAKLAYAKYSNFRVGAALQTANNTYTAANVENSSYGLSLCAERAAIAKAVSSGDRELIRIAVACIDAKSGDNINATMPCGACRQWFIEFSPNLEVLIWSPSGTLTRFIANELLSIPFRLDQVEETE
jgi:cytidine deaminase